MTTRYFHFTLGPVQGFVAQARRTRDFWAGSFILSWLAAVAMRSVQKQQGEIVFPFPDKNYLNWLEGHGKKSPPRQGNVPNRFKAKVTDNFSPQLVVDNVQTAWRELAELVWKGDLESFCHNDSIHRQIWQRQINHFFEMTWVLTENNQVANLLDRRKNWRNHFSPTEPGVKCMTMEGWQELSGMPSPDRKQQETFWQHLRNNLSPSKMDLAEQETLCAIAFVKRRFVHYFGQLVVQLPINQTSCTAFKDNQKIPEEVQAEKKTSLFNKQVAWIQRLLGFSEAASSDNAETEAASSNAYWTLKGWKLETGVPSVSYLATVHWLEHVIQNEDDDKLSDLHEAARQLGTDYGEWHTNIRCIDNAYQQPKKDRRRAIKRLTALDGRVFFESALQNDSSKPDKKVAAQNMLKALKALDLNRQPVPFYAILLMDGDSLGKHMSDTEKQPKISAALEKFTQQVPQTVYEHNGFLVYAGGDDVLAILPLEDALPCAAALRTVYLNAFNGSTVNSTLSGAIEFAHIKMPLTKILRDAHSLLDNVAKDGCGRDAIAVRVWKPGGKALEWAMPWKRALENNTKLVIEQLATQFGQQDEDKVFSSKFFYKIRERFDLLNPPKSEKTAILNQEQASTLLATDYLSSGVNDKRQISLADAKQTIATLLGQCRRVIRTLNENGEEQWRRKKRLEADGALLVRFLATKGMDSRP